MALSVKRFIHEINCPEPSEQTNVMYHPTSSDVLCAGGGTLTAIFADQNGLTNIQANESTTYAGDGDLCTNGMDVVFVVDYTGSMGGAIEGVKAGLNSLISTIDTQSGGNYRLGLVTFDGGSCNYNSSSYYTGLPAAQKINEACTTIITCFEKMGTVGNSTSFSTAVNSINNPSTGMPIGSSREWGGRAIDEVVNSNFAGSFRNNVQKLIILVTDDDPENNTTYFNNLFTTFNGGGYQLLYNSNVAANSTVHTEYNILLNTQPAGSAHYALNYNSTWTTGLIADIENLCEETFTYTCDEIAVGWYMEPGVNTAFYWDGTTWSQTDCEYTVKVNISKVSGSSTNWNLAGIPSSHPNYFDANTFIFTGTSGQSYSIAPWTIVPSTDYTIQDIVSLTKTTVAGSSVGFSVYTDNGVGDSGVFSSLGATEFNMVGSINGDAEHNVVIGAKVAANNYTMQFYLIADEPDVLNAGGGSQSPSGKVVLYPAVPEGFWLSANTSYPTKTSAIKYTFSGQVGSQHDYSVDLQPSPSDYSLSLTSYTTGSSTPMSIGDGAIGTSENFSGSFSMPSGGGTAEVFLDVEVNQPSYRFVLSVGDSIAGASVQTAYQSQIFDGYTGQEFDWLADLEGSASIASYTVDVAGSSANPSTYVSISSGAGAGEIHGAVTMPSGGGSSTVTVAGSSVPASFNMVISITDEFTDNATYGGATTVSGIAGEVISFTKDLTGKDAEMTYALTDVVNRNPHLGVTFSGTTISITVTMPSGGGTADLEAVGTNSAVNYSFNLTSVHSITNTSVVYADLTQGFTGPAGSTHAYTSDYTPNSGYSLNIMGASSNEATVTAGRVDHNTIGGTITMPSGGGKATVTATGYSTLITYRHEVRITEQVANGAIVGGNAEGVLTYAVDLAPGTEHTFSEALSLDSGYEYTSGPTIYYFEDDWVTGSINASGVISLTITAQSSAVDTNVAITGGTTLIQRSLTISYIENGDGGGEIRSGSGTGYSTYSSDYIYGPPGGTGTLYRYFMPKTGYVSASIDSITDNSFYVSETIGSAVGAGERFDVAYTIPNSNSTADVTINGSSVGATAATAATSATTKATAATTLATAEPCSCNFLVAKTNPTSSTSNNGSLDIVVSEACDPEFTWTLDGVEITPAGKGAFNEFTISNLDEGTYDLQLVDGRGCIWDYRAVLSAPVTTTAAPGEYYYTMQPCEGEGDCSWLIKSTVPLTRFQTYVMNPAIDVPSRLMMVFTAAEGLHDGTTSGETAECQAVNCSEYEGGGPKNPKGME